MPDKGQEVETKVLDARLANVEDAIMEMKESHKQTAQALMELVKLAEKNEVHRAHIERRLDQMDKLDERIRGIESEVPTMRLVKRGIFGAIGLALTAMFTLVWRFVTGQ
jgi:uncharacterized protein YjcR